ncbi:CPBP family intramembrane glutamic endopeptidase [Novosphingobium sp. B1]|uniref:CPBP family intramembrane glutamic endopeptidase n=1 Tax=Novosphingobium sp. B1 TaxID=1938756 RepID=UPI0020CB0C01|nr:CPBP family intramembrane glutamic endopeptidase [Novosphingobium sp. B1]
MILEFLAVSLIAGLAGRAIQSVIPRGGPAYTLGALVTVCIAAGAYLLGRRWLERSGNDEMPLSLMPRELSQGLVLGAMLFTVMTAIVALLGGFAIERVNGAGAIWIMLAMAISSGVVEELLFRAILLRHIEAMLGTWAALAITSLLFGAAHLANPGASLFAAFAIAMEAGILLGAAYLWKRRLWLPIGIHAAWNFTQGFVFSIPVSGSALEPGLFVTTRKGPEWLTGGAFGLEASVIAMLVATGAGLYLLVNVTRQGGIRPPMWVRR